MSAQITLQLDKPHYRPGDTVHGTIHLIAHSDLRPRGVTVHACGEEVTTLGPNTLMTERTHPFDLTFNVWLPTAHEDKLRQGEHDFPFDFTLPVALPPTFQGTFTHISYWIEAKVNLPLHTDIHHEQNFTVLPAPLIAADQPVQASAESPHGPKLELLLKAGGLYPGDHIQGTLQVSGVTPASITAASLEVVSHEKAEAREFADHFDKVRVRAEIDPAQLSSGQPFPIDLPIPEDADPSFVAQHSAKSRFVRARIDLADAPPLIVEAAVQLGVK